MPNKISKNTLTYLEKIITEDYNSSLADELFNEYCDLAPITKSSLGKKYTHDNSFDFLKLIRNEFLQKDELNYFDNHLKKYFSNIELEDPKKYLNNPYYKLLLSLDIKNVLKDDKYLPYEVFQNNDKAIKKDNFYGDFTSFGYFNSEYFYQRIIKDNKTWMSLIPHEINTMEKPISEAKGNVLTYGLGLGYFAFMCSSKEEVKSVTIIESDKEIIAFFNENILPNIETKNKIRIINTDAYSFKDVSNFDYIFVDIYHGENDGLECMLKFNDIDFKELEPHYWIETSILTYFKRLVVTSLNELFINSDYIDLGEETFEDSIINRTKSYIQKTYKKIETENIDYLLSIQGLKELIKSI